MGASTLSEAESPKSGAGHRASRAHRVASQAGILTIGLPARRPVVRRQERSSMAGTRRGLRAESRSVLLEWPDCIYIVRRTPLVPTLTCVT